MSMKYTPRSSVRMLPRWQPWGPITTHTSRIPFPSASTTRPSKRHTAGSGVGVGVAGALGDATGADVVAASSAPCGSAPTDAPGLATSGMGVPTIGKITGDVLGDGVTTPGPHAQRHAASRTAMDRDDTFGP